MRITDHITLIDRTMANCYDVETENGHVLVDAGLRSSGLRIANYYRQIGAKPSVILITHYHTDHIGGLRFLKNEFGSDVYISPLEAGVATGKDKITPGKTMRSKIITRMFKAPPVDSVKSTADLDYPGIEVLDTPGHTPGSTSYYFRNEGVLFIGDALVNRSGKLIINRGLAYDIDEAEKSEQKILSHGAKIILSGHGSPFFKNRSQ